jgi:hypothetical protein
MSTTRKNQKIKRNDEKLENKKGEKKAFFVFFGERPRVATRAAKR